MIDTTQQAALHSGPFSHALLTITRHNAERTLLALMELGNPAFLTAQLTLSISDIYPEALADLADSSLTQATFQGIALTDLACRAAITAGVKEDTAHEIRNRFSALYAAMTDPALQWTLACKMLLTYSHSIRDAALAGCSDAVSLCCRFIDEHFHLPMSLNDLGELCGLSAHYISDLFRTELGMGALQYIHQVKLLHARFLLEHTPLSIATIASLLSYPSHSNFSQQFKKAYGVTPGEYREFDKSI